jgi:hypothetical protein
MFGNIQDKVASEASNNYMNMLGYMSNHGNSQINNAMNLWNMQEQANRGRHWVKQTPGSQGLFGSLASGLAGGGFFNGMGSSLFGGGDKPTATE